MEGFNIGWIDFSKEQRNKVLSVINLLTEPEAVDELGIGIIRDGFSDIFFPGTSTIQTRAKYFLIVPYILYELENGKAIPANVNIDRLHKEELSLIDVLKRQGEIGIIGQSAGIKLKRKPSDIYWNGIKKYQIFKGGNISLYDYARVIYNNSISKQGARSQANIRNKDDSSDSDDSDSVSSRFVDGFWRLYSWNENWREDLTIDLTSSEAYFLKKQIITSCPDSLIGFILEKNFNKFQLLERFDDIEVMIKILPDNIKADYFYAKQFADFIYGAQLRFNVILSQGKHEKLIEIWEEWFSNIEQNANINLNELLNNRLSVKNRSLKSFLFSCKNAMMDKDIESLDNLIISRERKLKGDSRAKLHNVSEFEYKGWVGISKLQYRMKSAQNILDDIFEGLGENNVKTI